MKRRHFIRNAGVALSGTLAGVTTTSRAANVAADTNAIQKLHYALGYFLDQRQHENLVELLAKDAEVRLDLHVVHGCQLDQQESIELAADRLSARARFQCRMHVGNPLDDTLPMLEMDLARQQGHTVVQCWENGLFETFCVKEGDTWKIRRLDYRV